MARSAARRPRAAGGKQAATPGSSTCGGPRGRPRQPISLLLVAFFFVDSCFAARSTTARSCRWRRALTLARSGNLP